MDQTDDASSAVAAISAYLEIACAELESGNHGAFHFIEGEPYLVGKEAIPLGWAWDDIREPLQELRDLVQGALEADSIFRVIETSRITFGAESFWYGTDEFLRRALHELLRRQGGAVFDHKLCRGTLQALRDVLESGSVVYEIVVPLENLETSSELPVRLDDDLSICLDERSPTALDPVRVMGPRLALVGTLTFPVLLQPYPSALQHREHRSAEIQALTGRVRRAAEALIVVLGKRVWAFEAGGSPRVWLKLGTTHTYTQAPRYNFGAPDSVPSFSDFAKAWAAFDSETVRGTPFLQLAIRRLTLAAARNDEKDRLLDLMIAAEALFLAGDGQAELSFKLALRAALYLGDGSSVRRDIFKHFRRAYDLRSKIAHGEDPPVLALKGSEMSSSEFVSAMADYLHRAVIKAAKQISQEPKSPKKLMDWDSLMFGPDGIVLNPDGA